MENNTLTRSQIRSAIEDSSASPQSRLSAANLLINVFGLSDRNRRLAKSTAKRFSKYIAESPRSQMQVRFQAEKLLARIERALEGATVQPDDSIEENHIGTVEEQQSFSTKPNPIIGNTALLPPDAEDPFWDSPFGGSSRRRLFHLAWGLDITLTHSEIVIALIADLARLESRVVRWRLWACSREKLDQRFERDSEMIRAELAARGLPDTDDGRGQLVRQILASGEPLIQFENPAPAIDFDGTGLPVLIRSKIGQLIDAIDFVSKWPQTRLKHNPL